MIRNSCYKISLLLGLIIFLLFPPISIPAQIDLTRFYDSAHHWYDINDDERTIDPLPDQQKYKSTEFEYIADNILLFQKENGGWAKNFDVQANLSEEQKRKILNSKNILNTTFDNGATHSHLTYLAEVFTITNDEKYKIAFLKGLDFVFSAQYQNGGFPQFYPDTSGYKKYITFNDDAMIGVMELLYNIVYGNLNYEFVPEYYRVKVKAAFENGINCILNCQIVEAEIMNVWCQQHDNVNMKPQNARTFEPAAICNMESAKIVLFLMNIPNPSERIKRSIKAAVKWFEESVIFGLRVKVIDAPKVDFIYHSSTYDRLPIEDKNAPRIWARFYELDTQVPIFCNRDGIIVYSMDEVERERRTGYAWYHYAPEEVLSEFPKWLKKWE